MMRSRLLSLAVLTALGLSTLGPSLALARTPSDTQFADEWYAQKIGAPLAWDTSTGDHRTIVAVLDVGVNIEHPDLKKNIWINSREIPDNGLDDDGNGFVDDVHGWDFVDDDNLPLPPAAASPEVDMHGTSVSGIIAAVGNNAEGYAGLLWDGQIMPVRVLGLDGSGHDEAVARGIRYAVAAGADVINLSFAGSGMSADMEGALRDAYRAGVVVVAAMGNDGRSVEAAPVYPACAHSESEDWVLGVAASDELDTWTSFTNFGQSCADIAAPGTMIYGLGGLQGRYFGPWYGTSAAAPIISGSAALLRSAYPGLTVGDIRSALQLSVDPLLGVSANRRDYGVGRVNLAAALNIAAQLPSANLPARAKPTSAAPVPPVEQDQAKDSAYSYVALGAPVGASPSVRVYTADGKEQSNYLAYSDKFKGGVSVALDDLLSAYDGPEVVTAPGDGGGPHVRVFTSGGALISQFFPYDAKSARGVSVAAGDLMGDGQEGIVTAVGGGVSSLIKWFDVTGREAGSFVAKGMPLKERWGVAIADIDDDFEKEIVVYTLTGPAEAHVYDFDGTEKSSFVGVGSGMSVAAVDGDGDARDEFVISTRRGSAAALVFRADGAMIRQLFAFAEIGGQIAAADIDIDGHLDIVALSSKGGDVVMYHTDGTRISTLVSGVAPGSSLAAW